MIRLLELSILKSLDQHNLKLLEIWNICYFKNWEEAESSLEHTKLKLS